MKNKFLINPFSLYGVAFGIVLLFYSFGWSAIYPKLSSSLLAFLIVTIVVMFSLGYLFYRRNYFYYTKISANQSSLGWQLIGCYFLLVVEFIAARSIPFLSLLRESGFDYTNFGLPFIHVIYAAYQGVLALFIFHCFLSKPKGERKRLGWYIFWSLIPGILIVNRAMVMTTIIGMAIIYLMQVQSIRKIMITFSFSAMVLLYLFGLMGNLRINGRSDSGAIMSIGQATDDFKENVVPGEFFWSYLYVASPLGNLQYNIDTKDLMSPVTDQDVQKMIIYEFMPEMLSKRIASGADIDRKKVKLVNPVLNAYSVYAAAYSYLGWAGMWLMFIFSLFFIFFNLLLLPRNSPYFITGVALISTVMILNIFNNFFAFMNVVSQLFVVNLLSLPYLINMYKERRSIKRTI